MACKDVTGNLGGPVSKVRRAWSVKMGDNMDFQLLDDTVYCGQMKEDGLESKVDWW